MSIIIARSFRRIVAWHSDVELAVDLDRRIHDCNYRNQQATKLA